MTWTTLALSIGEDVIITYSAFFGFDDIQLAAMQLVDAANVQVLQREISLAALRAPTNFRHVVELDPAHSVDHFLTPHSKLWLYNKSVITNRQGKNA